MHLAIIFARAGSAPARQPCIHAQRRIECFQWLIQQSAGGMPEQHLGGLVGVAHATVPVEPEDADGAVIETKLRQTLRFFGRLAQLDVAAGGLQPAFQHSMLAPLPGEHQQAGQQQNAEQQAETAPVADLAAQINAAGLEPLFLQLTEFPRRKLPQRRIEHGREFGAVTQ